MQTSLRRFFCCYLFLTLLWLGSGVWSIPARAADQNPIKVATTGTFENTLERLAAEFARQTDELLPIISGGSTRQRYSEIIEGIPYDLFFSLDQDLPKQLEAADLIVPGSRRTYAIAKLVAWRPGHPWRGTLAKTLADRDVKVVAIADPGRIASFGLAAQQVLASFGKKNSLPFEIEQSPSLIQVFRSVASGKAQLGFIALSQVREADNNHRRIIEKEILEIDTQLYTPITHDVVRLKSSANKPEVGRFLDFVLGPQGRAIIAAAGYTLP